MDYGDEKCAHCGGLIKLRNPTGNCDHMRWPENLTAEAMAANGFPPPPTPAVWTLVWDHDDGMGCNLFATEAARDAELMTCLLSHCYGYIPEECEGMLAWETYNWLSSNGWLDGVRFTGDQQVVRR